MFEIINVGAVNGGEAFLIMTDKKNALVDTGFGFCADKVVENIEKQLGEKTLDYLLLTHSHYDHASGAPHIRARWPEVNIVAAEHARKVFTRPTALSVMKEMNDNAARQRGYSNYSPMPGDISVDTVVKEDDIIDLGDVKFRVLEVPGHTRDCLAFYSEEKSFLIGNETFGGIVENFKYVIPFCLVGYQMTLDSIKKGVECNAEHVLVSHHGIISGEESRKYFDLAIENAKKTKEMIVEGYKNGMNFDELIELFKKTYFTQEFEKVQPEAAFMLNTKYTVKMILKECLGVEISE